MNADPRLTEELLKAMKMDVATRGAPAPALSRGHPPQQPVRRAALATTQLRG